MRGPAQIEDLGQQLDTNFVELAVAVKQVVQPFRNLMRRDAAGMDAWLRPLRQYSVMSLTCGKGRTSRQKAREYAEHGRKT